MNRKLILRLPPKSKILIYAQIVWVMIMLWLRDVVGLPSLITYFTDVIVLCLLGFQINRIRTGIRHTSVKSQSRILMAMGIGIVCGLVLNLVNPLLVVWATRNNMRFYVFFYICIGLLDKQDINKLIALFLRFFWANVVLCAYQYFVLGLYGDNLGGFFGVRQGSNAYMNVFLCLVSSFIIGEYYAGKAGFSRLVIYVVACVFVAFMAELKAFYLEIFLIFAAAMVLKGTSWKTVLILCLGAVGIVVLGIFLSRYDAYTFILFTDMDAFEYYLSGGGYTNSGDLNRFSAIQQIYDMFYKDNPLKSVFGLGFGSCEYSQFDFLQSAFSRQYEHLNYRWFTHAWIFLEQGAFGLSMIVLFFLSILRFCVKKRKEIQVNRVIMAFCFTMTCLVDLIYNCAVQLEACYIIAFVCAIPFIESKKDDCCRTAKSLDGEATQIIGRA